MLVKDLKQKLRAVLADAARTRAGEGEIRPEELAAEAVTGSPDLWKAARQPLAMEQLVGMARSVVRNIAGKSKEPNAQAELPFESVPIIKHVPPMIRTKDGWVASPKATLAQLEYSNTRSEKGLEKKAERTKAERRAALSMRNLTRIVKYFGKGDPGVTVEAALQARAEWMEKKKQRLAKRKKSSSGS